MQVPGGGVAMLAEDPERLAVRIGRDEIIAPHLFAVPPSAFDAFGTREKRELSLKARATVVHDEALRTMHQPYGPRRISGARGSFSRRARSKMAPDAVFLGPMIVGDGDA